MEPAESAFDIESVHRFLRTTLSRAVVGFQIQLLDSNGNCEAMYVWTGFVVKLEDRGVLVTAAHCAKEIARVAKSGKSALSNFLILTSEDSYQIVSISLQGFKYRDFQSWLQSQRQSSDFAEIVDRDVELLDIAIWDIPDQTWCYMINSGIAPFEIHQLVPSSETIAALWNSEQTAYFVAGFPDKFVEYNSSLAAPCFELHFAQLAPAISDGKRGGEHANLRLESLLTAWMPVVQQSIYADGSFRGMSGGPVVAILGNTLVVIGVMTHQFPGGSNTPKSIAFCCLHSVFAERLYDLVPGI